MDGIRCRRCRNKAMIFIRQQWSMIFVVEHLPNYVKFLDHQRKEYWVLWFMWLGLTKQIYVDYIRRKFHNQKMKYKTLIFLFLFFKKKKKAPILRTQSLILSQKRDHHKRKSFLRLSCAMTLLQDWEATQKNKILFNLLIHARYGAAACKSLSSFFAYTQKSWLKTSFSTWRR